VSANPAPPVRDRSRRRAIAWARSRRVTQSANTSRAVADGSSYGTDEQRGREAPAVGMWSGALASAAQLHLIGLLHEARVQRLDRGSPVLALCELREPGLDRAPRPGVPSGRGSSAGRAAAPAADAGATSDSSSPTSSAWRPAARSASIRCSSAASRSSSKRAISPRAKCSYARSANAGPRESARA
jgi:hypothetical protein